MKWLRLRSRRARIIGWISVAVVAILVAVPLGVYAVVSMQLSSITHIVRIDGHNRPHRYSNALNILLLGSDSRTGANAAIGGQNGCNCSDTIMLAHISPGRRSVTVISIPRDTVVPYYQCAPWRGLPGQQANPYAYERINATLAAGGPECVRETVEQQTGVFIDNVIELNFTGFEKVINDVGGVNVCLPFAIHNTITSAEGSGLDLTAGRHHIDGRVALEFWRTRYNVADGSDIARIARDQYLMAQIVKGVLHSGMLGSPSTVYTVMGDVANAMTTDASNSDLLHIALSLRGISPKNIQFITAPWASYPYDPNEVELAHPQADALFWAIAHDTKLPKITRHKAHSRGKGAKASASPSPSASTGPVLVLSPTQVKVTVLNGSSGTDLTAQAAAALGSRGFTVLGTGYANATTYTTSVIEYGSAADLPAARTLAAQFSRVRINFVPGVTAGTVEVILGSTFTKLAKPKPTSPSSLNSLSTNYGGITASVSCRNSAFYGVDTPQSGQAASCPCG
ncbi:MAG TPA: LCP family protein [Streptosporangiaceae bacterium]